MATIRKRKNRYQVQIRIKITLREHFDKCKLIKKEEDQIRSKAFEGSTSRSRR